MAKTEYFVFFLNSSLLPFFSHAMRITLPYCPSPRSITWLSFLAWTSFQILISQLCLDLADPFHTTSQSYSFIYLPIPNTHSSSFHAVFQLQQCLLLYYKLQSHPAHFCIFPMASPSQSQYLEAICFHFQGPSQSVLAHPPFSCWTLISAWPAKPAFLTHLLHFHTDTHLNFKLQVGEAPYRHPKIISSSWL